MSSSSQQGLRTGRFPSPLYTLLRGLVLPFIPLRLLLRSRKEPGYRRHWRERFGFYRTEIDRPVIWVHAVSVGETQAAAPLVAALCERFPDHAVLTTHMTPTGRAAARRLFGDNAPRAYVPYDYRFAVRGFLRHFKPRVGILLETELWPVLLSECSRAHVPMVLANARLSERSAARYNKVPRLAAAMLQSLTEIAAQTEADAVRLTALGARAPTVCGNVKFDIVMPEPMRELGAHLRRLFGIHRTVWVAASTRSGEETLVLDAMLRCGLPDALLVLVPRHPQRFEEVAGQLAMRSLRFQRRSEDGPIRPSTQVVLGDSMGEMFAYYAASDAAFIGGSLVPTGGQNLIEACAAGTPVLVGPHTYNFKSVTEDAIAAGAALRVTDAAELGRAAELDDAFLELRQVCVRVHPIHGDR